MDFKKVFKEKLAARKERREFENDVQFRLDCIQMVLDMHNERGETGAYLAHLGDEEELANAVARRLIDKGYTLRKYSLNNKAWYWVY